MKTLLGSIITNISGNLGGHTAETGRGGSRLRSNRVQKKSNTCMQEIIRNRIQVLSRQWKSLLQSERDAYLLLTHGRESTYDAYRRLTFNDVGNLFTLSYTDASQSFIFGVKTFRFGICLASAFNGGRLLRSVDYGASFKNLGQLFGQTQLTWFLSLPDNSIIGFTSPNGKVIRSVDYGSNFTDLGSPSAATRYSAAYASLNGTIIATSTTGTILIRSTTLGLSWSVTVIPFAQSQLRFIFCTSSGKWFAGGASTGVLITSDNDGISWASLGIILAGYIPQFMCESPNGRLCLILTLNPNSYMAISDDNGLTWSVSSVFVAGLTYCKFVTVSKVIVLASNNSNVYISNDGGKTFPIVLAGTGNVGCNQASTFGDTILIVGGLTLGKITRSII